MQARELVDQAGPARAGPFHVSSFQYAFSRTQVAKCSLLSDVW